MKAFAQFGVGVWMLILMCVLSLIYAVWFARRGGARRLRVVMALSAGTFFTTLAAVLMGMVGTGRLIMRLASLPPSQTSEDLRTYGLPTLFRFLVPGLSEAFAGGVLGFGTLGLVALIVALALGRGVAVE